MDMRRIRQNLFGEWFRIGRAFPPEVLEAVTRLVAEGEGKHRGELRVAIESRLPLSAVVQGVTARDRAAMLFAHLRVWDTEENCGVLLYVLLAEHRIEIVADRGIAKRVTASEWESITAHMRDEFAAGRLREGLLTGVTEAGALLATYYPGDGSSRENQLPDRPLVL
ncbi:TPM domain-containing protein [Luteibacter aegosomatis]|uniref:TPM domain-containing protein n=1 Tax=Luteibacter aegosomatis TaxID=2911537 RepID=UPI001FFB8E10|nr:TPM domain-containing protein [Luteibacter aegosomatis]UPG86992.1 TPM domain-containing protein [Luteibacter aegosomatis]